MTEDEYKRDAEYMIEQILNRITKATGTQIESVSVKSFYGYDYEKSIVYTVKIKFDENKPGTIMAKA